MNRIKMSPLAATERKVDADLIAGPHQRPATLPVESFEKIAFGANDDVSLFVPMHYEKNYAYPLIVWLHGDQHSADQLQRVMPTMSMRNFVGVAPTAPAIDRERNQHWLQDSVVIDEAHEAVIEAVDYATMRCQVAPQRIFLAGSEQGGTMAFRLAFQRPDLFAGVISLNGPLPTSRSVLGDWCRCRDMPVFWAHSRDSVDFQQSTMCDQLKLLHVAGFSVTLRQYPGFEVLSDKMLTDCNQWVMESIQSVVS